MSRAGTRDRVRERRGARARLPRAARRAAAARACWCSRSGGGSWITSATSATASRARASWRSRPTCIAARPRRDPDAAGRLMMDLELPRAARDLDGAVAALLGETATAGGTRRRGRLLHGRAARAARRHAESPHRRGGGLLRHPPERDARVEGPRRAGARHLRGAGRLRAARGGAQARGRAARRRQALPTSPSSPASTTPS